MNPHRFIEEHCRRYGVPLEFGKRLTPLVERANSSPAEKKARILDLVTRSFEQEARRAEDRQEPTPPSRRLSPGERKILLTVASILHAWSPPGWLEQWGEGREAG